MGHLILLTNNQVTKGTMKCCADVLSWRFRMAAPCTTIFALVLSVIYFVCITSHPARENSVRLKVRQAQALKIFFSFHVHTTSTESYMD